MATTSTVTVTVESTLVSEPTSRDATTTVSGSVANRSNAVGASVPAAAVAGGTGAQGLEQRVHA